MAEIRRTKDGTRRIVTTGSQTSTAKLTRGEIEYLEWIEARDRAAAEKDRPAESDPPPADLGPTAA